MTEIPVLSRIFNFQRLESNVIADLSEILHWVLMHYLSILHPFCSEISLRISYLNVSKIMVNNTNFPSKGTTSEVGGMISASKRKNTVSESKMEMERLT